MTEIYAIASGFSVITILLGFLVVLMWKKNRKLNAKIESAKTTFDWYHHGFEDGMDYMKQTRVTDQLVSQGSY